MGAFFEIYNVKYTTLLKTNDEFKVSGNVKLIGIPFIGPLWVDATITFPPKIVLGVTIPEPLGTPTITKTAIAILDHFSFDFPAPTGMDRQGDYKLDLNLYLGPETQISYGSITSKNVSIPPFPPVASIPTATFTISGTGATEAVSFEFGTLTINPSTVENGKVTTLTLPVTNIGTQDQSGVTIKMEVTEMGATDISLPGTSRGYQTFGPYDIAAGGVQVVTWDWTANGANTGKWLVGSVYVNGALSPNTEPTNPNIFKQTFNVTGPVVSFNFGTLTINPANVFLGESTQLSFDVVNAGTEPQTVRMHVDITEVGGVYPGAIVGSQDFPLTSVQPGAHWKLAWNWMATGQVQSIIAGGTGGSTSGGKWVITTLYDSSGNLVPGVGPNNPQIYKQTFNILSNTPVVTSIGISITSTAKWGQSISVTIPFNYQGPAKNLTAELDLGEGSLIPGVPFTIVNTWRNVFSVPDTLTSTAKSVTMQIIIPSGMTPKKYDSVTSILDGNGNPLGTPYIDHGIITITGQGTSTAQVQIINPNAQVTQNATLDFGYSGYLANAVLTVTIVGNGVNNVLQAQTGANGTGSSVYYDYDPLGTYTITIKDSAGNTASATYTVVGVSRVPTASASFSNGVLSYSYSGFASSSTIAITAGNSVAINVTSNSSGAGSGTVSDTDPAGTYTMAVWDNTGATAYATFTIPTSGGGGGYQQAYASYNTSTGMLSYAFSGFTPYDNITITAGNSVIFQTSADANGNGSGNVVDNDPPGTYVMAVQDSLGVTADASFTI